MPTPLRGGCLSTESGSIGDRVEPASRDADRHARRACAGDRSIATTRPLTRIMTLARAAALAHLSIRRDASLAPGHVAR